MKNSKKPKKKPNPKKRTAKKRAPAKRAKRTAKKSVRKASRKHPASRPRKRAPQRRNPRQRPSLIRALIPIADMEALARGAAGDIESLSNPRKRIRMRRATKGKRGKGTRRNPFQHLIIRRRKKR